MLSGFFVTKKGKNLLAKTHDGANIELTRAEIGSGDIPEGQLVTEVTSLYGKVKELPLGEVKVGSGKEVCIPVQLTNKGVLTSFLFKEIGVYAIDPDEGEILYLYGNTDVTGDVPDEVKSESESQVDYLFNLLLNIDNTTKVDVNVDNSLIYATLQNLSDMADTKVDKVAGKGLSTEDYTTAEKNKLAGIAAGANKYVHPSNHPMSMITGLGTAATKNTGTTAGNIPLIGSDGLLPTSVLPPPLIVENVLTSTSTVNALSAAQGKVLNDAKVDKVSGKGLSTNDYTTAEKNKLAGIAAGANNYVHPPTHPVGMITGLGTAATKDVGTAEGNVVGVNSDGEIDSTLIGSLDHVGTDGYIVYPSGGQFNSRLDNITGMLKITLPMSWAWTMLKFKVSIFNLAAATSVDYIISGYTFDTTPSWMRTTAYCVSPWGGKLSNLPVSFGHDGTKCAITIGTPTTTWNNPHFVISDVSVSFNNADYDQWKSGWSLSLVTEALPTVNTTISNTNIAYNVNHADSATTLTGLTATSAELNYVDGVTSNIQTQLNSKQTTITGGASSITSTNLTADKALISNSSGKVVSSAVTSTELSYLDGVTSNIQTQLNSKSASGHTHSAATTSTAGFMSAADKTKLEATNVAYGTCSTAAATAAKVVTLSGNTNWKLTVGSIVTVTYTYTNTAVNPTLNVNGTGAKSICLGSAVITTSNLNYAGLAQRPINYMYNGAQYVVTGWGGDNNTTYAAMTAAEATTGTTTTARTISAKVLHDKIEGMLSESLSGSGTGQTWHAKDILGSGTTSTADATAESGYSVTIDTTVKNLNGSASKYKAPFGTYVAIFRVQASTVSGSADKVKLEMWGTSAAIASRTLKLSDFSAASKWEYFKIPFETDSTSGRDIYPKVTCLNATGNVKVDNIVVVPNAFALM